ncbi:low molecular weight phosphotyrosine protein phosphatase [Actinomyces glycerinitolerans]|uniref:protein-tyrosine-phosphatase n=2 Tax=Actinomycetaceae TaxID=2049 RepID=A0A1M4RYZ6_9ACTO|nr:low molecular weight phosphotyrosine protein phosphatase [Actinomyces glycerinitolerans]
MTAQLGSAKPNAIDTSAAPNPTDVPVAVAWPADAVRRLPVPRDPAAAYQVVMVCTGNICRSAMAEVVLLDRLLAADVPTGGPGSVVVTSAGVSDEESGNPMDPRARRILTESGYGVGADPAARATAAAIAEHAAHRIADAELRRADLILAMTSAHRRVLRRRSERLGVDPARIRMFREYDPTAAAGTPGAPEHAANLDVPDPWYGTMADFVDTLAVVERVSDALAPALAELVGAAGAR